MANLREIVRLCTGVILHAECKADKGRCSVRWWCKLVINGGNIEVLDIVCDVAVRETLIGSNVLSY